MRGVLILAALALCSCSATDIDLPPAPSPPAAAVPPTEPGPQTEVRPVPELPDLAPAGGIARAEEEPLSERRSGLADDALERRLDCNDEPTPSDRDVRNAFLRQCPPYDR
jgi:hypothetical protein